MRERVGDDAVMYESAGCLGWIPAFAGMTVGVGWEGGFARSLLVGVTEKGGDPWGVAAFFSVGYLVFGWV